MRHETRPPWAMRKTPDEGMFCVEFIKKHPLSCMHGRFYDENGSIQEESHLRQEIYRMVRAYYQNGLQSKTETLLNALRMELEGSRPRQDIHLIHVKNGTVDINEGFQEYKYVCANRLPVSYKPETYCPQHWLAFLEELLEPTDILTLQEFMGYCLIPTNVAQKMLLIIGEGGEGKSRIGVVMRSMLGDAMKNGSISKIEHDRFARADLEDALVMVDDDLKLEALNSTNHIKSIITADTPMDLERKGKQSYQGKLYCRLMAFGNGSLHSLHDRSYGFFRRQIILTAKPKPANRVDDPFLGMKLAQEADSIFLWCLEGLQRLIDQNFQFTLSDKAKENWQKTVNECNNIVEFMNSVGYIQLSEESMATSKMLYEVYREWCADNTLHPLSSKTFLSFLCSSAHHYGLMQTNHIPIGNGKQARGFRGIRILPRY